MSDDTARIGIGELSRRTGVAVRTIRFYCDEGVLVCERTSGGHRTFAADAVARLTTLRQLRRLGIGLPTATAVLDGSRSSAEAIAAERAAVSAEVAALTWRHATLRALEDSATAQRSQRLDLLAAVVNRGPAEDRMTDFWRRLLGPLPAALFEGFAAMNLPKLPADPTPNQLLTFAELVAHLSAPHAKATMSQSIWRSRPADIRDRRGLLVGLAEAGAQVAPLLGSEPRPGPALDHFVAAHADARGITDTPGFRNRLYRASRETDPWIHRYWTLTSTLVGPDTSGAAQLWLHRALEHSMALDPVDAGPRRSPMNRSARIR
ncbi:MerR family transcriptional regulator [Nocardia sp. NPDC127579]|uniref:helix-turn-helix domain-containing protein n=1 Tax=Nocardia sp. NPDC127579 TaxID=3345402 RepID=UPI003627C47F